MPVIQEIPYCDPLIIFNSFAHQTWAMFLESADHAIHSHDTNQFSYIAIDPFMTLRFKNHIMYVNDEKHSCDDPFQFVKELLKPFAMETLPDLPLFQGGCVGYWSYDLNRYLEKVSSPKLDDMQYDELRLGFYDVVISFDHVAQKAWIISNGFPELNNELRHQRAMQRAEWLLKQLPTSAPFAEKLHSEPVSSLSCYFNKESYMAAVDSIIKHIRAGDVYEANMTQRFIADVPAAFNPWALYQRLRHINPAPFAAYLNLADMQIASASPERFLKLAHRIVESRPIKGTVRRCAIPEEDDALKLKLLSSEKDRAENIMIVDLMRNDLSRVCELHSIDVPQLCGLETFATVHHLISVVTGKLKQEYDAVDLLKVTFPAGSITGAPKINAMEILAQLEPHCRGPYSGSVGYLAFNGQMDLSVVIRTFIIKNKKITFQTGGAVVIDSCAEEEYQETLHKAAALKKSLMSEASEYDFND